MTDTEFLVLNHLDIAGPTEAGILWQMLSVEKYRNTKSRLTDMVDKNYIKYTSGASLTAATYSILPAGEDALDVERKRIALEKQRLNEQRQSASNDKAEKAADRKFQLLNTLFGAVAGGLITLFMEHVVLQLFLHR